MKFHRRKKLSIYQDAAPDDAQKVNLALQCLLKVI
jgi:hypothetical protein